MNRPSPHPPLHDLVGRWLRGRSLARGLPPPVADRGGWRVDTGSADEERRHVFGAVLPGLAELAAQVTQPRVLLKLCGDAATLAPLLPSRWRILPPGYLMTAGRTPAARHVPPGFALELSRTGAVTAARIVTGQGELAASGWAAEVDGVFVYDRIAVAADHRRRGLGAALVHALGNARQDGRSAQVLVATADGRALYAALGWRELSPYTTAHIPG